MDLRLCDCGCGEPIPVINKLGKPARYKHGHNDAGGRFRKSQYAGNKHPKWKGGRYVRKDGYVQAYIGNVDGERIYELEHRLVVERHLGRKLRYDEQIHHKNGNRADNRIENLSLTTIGEHTSSHWHSEKKFRLRYVMQPGKPNKFGGTVRITSEG